MTCKIIVEGGESEKRKIFHGLLDCQFIPFHWPNSPPPPPDVLTHYCHCIIVGEMDEQSHYFSPSLLSSLLSLPLSPSTVHLIASSLPSHPPTTSCTHLSLSPSLPVPLDLLCPTDVRGRGGGPALKKSSSSSLLVFADGNPTP